MTSSLPFTPLISRKSTPGMSYRAVGHMSLPRVVRSAVTPCLQQVPSSPHAAARVPAQPPPRPRSERQSGATFTAPAARAGSGHARSRRQTCRAFSAAPVAETRRDLWDSPTFWCHTVSCSRFRLMVQTSWK